MKTDIYAKVFAVVLLASFMAGCAGTKVNIDSYVPQNIDRSTGKIVKGSASGFQLFWLIPISINGRQARAYEELKRNAGDAYISDVKIAESWKYAFVGTVYGTSFEATAYPKTATIGPLKTQE